MHLSSKKTADRDKTWEMRVKLRESDELWAEIIFSMKKIIENSEWLANLKGRNDFISKQNCEKFSPSKFIEKKMRFCLLVEGNSLNWKCSLWKSSIGTHWFLKWLSFKSFQVQKSQKFESIEWSQFWLGFLALCSLCDSLVIHPWIKSFPKNCVSIQPKFCLFTLIWCKSDSKGLMYIEYVL